MSDLAIRVEGLSKQYRLGGGPARPATLRDQLRQWASLQAWRQRPTERRVEFWALKDVCFDVKQGDVVGVIGRNGAGKSTLLKILARITEPTAGMADVRGRVGSLLEVGTGFHPELSGRENVFLNGAILGMRRAEIARKFDAVVAFAEVEKFIDTPVKHYSSGMYTRLAFAVAAHLEPEILIVDEVLAVGDAAFQKKCLGKMGEVAAGGRTVLFVSHNMGLIQALCRTALLLDSGRVEQLGPTAKVVARYLAGGAAAAAFERPEPGPGVEVAVLGGSAAVVADNGHGRLDLTVKLRAARPRTISLDIRVTDPYGVPVGFAPVGSFARADELDLPAGPSQVVVSHDISRLASGTYSVSIDVAETMVGVFDRVEHCLLVEYDPPPAPGCFRRLQQGLGHGCVELPYLAGRVVPL
jgi:lipopolysaccharide transport system ATP-binding protein